MRKGVQFEERDIFRQPLNETEIARLTGKLPLEALVSTKSPSFRALGLEIGQLGREQALRLLASEPRLIRRPIVEVDDRLVVGFDPNTYEELFSGLDQSSI